MLVKVAGASYHQLVVKASKVDDPVRLEMEPSNAFDPFAIRLINCRLESSTGNGWLGFIPRKYSQKFTRAIVKGHTFDAKIASISGSSRVGAKISLSVASRASSSNGPAPAIAVTGP